MHRLSKLIRIRIFHRSTTFMVFSNRNITCSVFFQLFRRHCRILTCCYTRNFLILISVRNTTKPISLVNVSANEHDHNRGTDIRRNHPKSIGFLYIIKVRRIIAFIFLGRSTKERTTIFYNNIRCFCLSNTRN